MKTSATIAPKGNGFVFTDAQFLPISIEKAWEFFSSPANLSKITPPEMQFEILTELTESDIYEGMIIDYNVKPMLGIKTHWQTEISHVKKHAYFTDNQVKGPYKKWEHTHTFTPQENGVLMHDVVEYELPYGWLGKLVNQLVVGDKIKSIFTHRRKVLENLFPE